MKFSQNIDQLTNKHSFYTATNSVSRFGRFIYTLIFLLSVKMLLYHWLEVKKGPGMTPSPIIACPRLAVSQHKFTANPLPILLF